MDHIYLFLIIIIAVEINLLIIIKVLRKFYNKSFDWRKNKIITNLITEEDLKIKIDKNDLIRNKLYFFDPDLGTTNKENISNSETFYSGNKLIRSKYRIGKLGERFNNLFNKRSKISTYGDSLTFCRYVNDYETWQYFLSKKLKQNVKNFGVGNYGLDQSYLKYKKNKKKKIDKSKIVIFGFGPETIRRNLSVWKHYFEFGNVYNFKPRYKQIGENRFKFIRNKIRNLDELYKANKIFKKTIDYDFFYKNKFKKYLWKFPYIFSLGINFTRKSKIIIFLTLKLIEIKFNKKIFKICNEKLFSDLYNVGPLFYDFQDKIKLLRNSEAIDTTLHIVKKIKKENKKTILIIIPSQLDFFYYKKFKKSYYDNLIKKISRHVICLDILKLIPKNIKMKDIYTEKGYGAHLNKKGNLLLSNIIFEFLKKNEIK